MQIFVVDTDPVQAAKDLADAHVVKMVLESAQILCIVVVQRGGTAAYKSNHHQTHPCVLWAMESRSNFDWLCAHAMALCAEYTYRYDKVHKSQQHIEHAITCRRMVPWGLATPHPVVRLGKDTEYPSDPTGLYREYYCSSRYAGGILRWHKARSAPDWYVSRTAT
jgi:hypothetical protein